MAEIIKVYRESLPALRRIGTPDENGRVIMDYCIYLKLMLIRSFRISVMYKEEAGLNTSRSLR